MSEQEYIQGMERVWATNPCAGCKEIDGRGRHLCRGCNMARDENTPDETRALEREYFDYGGD